MSAATFTHMQRRSWCAGQWGLAHLKPRHDVSGNQTYVFHLAGLPHQNRRNLGAVTPVPPPFLSCSYVDDFRHVLLISDAYSVPDSTDNGTEQVAWLKEDGTPERTKLAMVQKP